VEGMTPSSICEGSAPLVMLTNAGGEGGMGATGEFELAEGTKAPTGWAYWAGSGPTANPTDSIIGSERCWWPRRKAGWTLVRPNSASLCMGS
jgi:hypothetical protein